jgi:hypothetical protein
LAARTDLARAGKVEALAPARPFANRGYRFGGLNSPATQPAAASIGSISIACFLRHAKLA